MTLEVQMHFSQWVMLSYMKSPLLDSLHFAVTHVTDATRTLLFLVVGWENRTVHTLYIVFFRGPTVQRSHDQPSLLKKLQRFYVNKLD